VIQQIAGPAAFTVLMVSEGTDHTRLCAVLYGVCSCTGWYTGHLLSYSYVIQCHVGLTVTTTTTTTTHFDASNTFGTQANSPPCNCPVLCRLGLHQRQVRMPSWSNPDEWGLTTGVLCHSLQRHPS
jgi:hypothetical protein